MNSRQFRAVLERISQSPAESRPALIEQRLADEPRCPVARYLRGCHRSDRNRRASAVRDLMIAHHAEPQLESAALLVFAGLSGASRSGALLPVLLETWEEFRRPKFDRGPRERALLDAFDEPIEGLGNLSPLARQFWRLPIAGLRGELRTVIASADRSVSPLLLAVN